MGNTHTFIASCGCKNLCRSDLVKMKINGNGKLMCPNHPKLQKGIILFVITKCSDCGLSFYSKLQGYHIKPRCSSCQEIHRKIKVRNRTTQIATEREKERTANKKSKYQKGNSIYYKSEEKQKNGKIKNE